jgi:tetratricopeptide (TPR) repeat protein
MKRSLFYPSLGCVFLALLLCFAGKVHAQEADAFARANQEFAAGRFGEALDLYNGLVNRGEMSAALFYNIGNTWYRSGDLGQAILNYERALVLEPHHPEAEANLRLVRDKARALELRQNPVERAVGRGTSAQYAIAVAVSFWVAAFALAGWLLARRRSSTLVAILSLSVLLLAGCGYALYLLETGANGGALAIVTAKTTEARLATADNAGTVLALPPGSEINILSTRGDWSYAALPNNLRGWIPAKNAQRVRM